MLRDLVRGLIGVGAGDLELHDLVVLDIAQPQATSTPSF